jgi:hypothetical protein
MTMETNGTLRALHILDLIEDHAIYETTHPEHAAALTQAIRARGAPVRESTHRDGARLVFRFEREGAM